MQLKILQNFIDFIRNKDIKLQYKEYVENLCWLKNIISIDNSVIDDALNKKISILYREKAFTKDCTIVQKYLNSHFDITKFPKSTGEFREEQIKLTEFAYTLTKELENTINIHPMLTGGCLIGAVRHQGFIPWDDDIDFDLMFDEFERLVNYVKTNYVYVESNSDIAYIKHRELIHKALLGNPNKIIFSLKPSCLSAYIGTSIADCLTVDFFPRYYINPKIQKKDYIKYRERFNSLFNKDTRFTKLFKVMDKEIKNEKIYVNHSDVTAYGFGNISFANKHFSFLKTEDILPYKQIDFEGKTFYTMNNTEKYLKDFYGDYMSFPIKLDMAKYKNKYTKILENEEFINSLVKE